MQERKAPNNSSRRAAGWKNSFVALWKMRLLCECDVHHGPCTWARSSTELHFLPPRGTFPTENLDDEETQASISWLQGVPSYLTATPLLATVFVMRSMYEEHNLTISHATP